MLSHLFPYGKLRSHQAIHRSTLTLPYHLGDPSLLALQFNLAHKYNGKRRHEEVESGSTEVPDGEEEKEGGQEGTEQDWSPKGPF